MIDFATIGNLKVIDLSSNRLTGYIPYDFIYSYYLEEVGHAIH